MLGQDLTDHLLLVLKESCPVGCVKVTDCFSGAWLAAPMYWLNHRKDGQFPWINPHVLCEILIRVVSSRFYHHFCLSYELKSASASSFRRSRKTPKDKPFKNLHCSN